MILEQFGVTLKRVELADIELIRKHRNSPEIRRNMEYKKHISAPAQIKWFESINNPNNYYFLILTEGKPVGVINAKNIDWKEKFGEGGIFIWDEEAISHSIAALASVLFLNFCFDYLQFDLSYVKIMSSNTKAIAYNKSIGYRFVPYQENQRNQLYILTKERYTRHVRKLVVTLSKIYKDQAQLTIRGSITENNHPIVNRLLKSVQ